MPAKCMNQVRSRLPVSRMSTDVSSSLVFVERKQLSWSSQDAAAQVSARYAATIVRLLFAELEDA